jgi:hypothetical protein
MFHKKRRTSCWLGLNIAEFRRTVKAAIVGAFRQTVLKAAEFGIVLLFLKGENDVKSGSTEYLVQ